MVEFIIFGPHFLSRSCDAGDRRNFFREGAAEIGLEQGEPEWFHGSLEQEKTEGTELV